MSERCRYVMLLRDNLVYECMGDFYADGKHFHEYPKLTPPRPRKSGDIIDTEANTR